MPPNELLLVGAHVRPIEEALAAYDGVNVITSTAVAFALRLVQSDAPPAALYLEDTVGATEDLWRAAELARGQGVTLLLGLQGAALSRRADFADASVPLLEVREPAATAAWIAQQLGLTRKLGAASQRLIAVSGAKGGIGKTTVLAAFAEGLRRRGLRVLIVDGDLSNSGLVPTFRIPAGFPGYLQIQPEGLSAWTVENVRRCIYQHAPTGIHFLLAAELTSGVQDLLRPEWEALMRAVRGLEEYDVVLLDTGPDLRKRPYALLAARDGGWVILPTPPGRKERNGTGNALLAFQTSLADRDLTDRCLLVFMQPEKGVVASIDGIAPLFRAQFPRATLLGVLPRAAQLLSMADESAEHYRSPLALGEHSPFARAVHTMVDQLCAHVGLTPPLPMPRSTWWQQLRCRKAAPANAPAALAMPMSEARV